MPGFRVVAEFLVELDREKAAQPGTNLQPLNEPPPNRANPESTLNFYIASFLGAGGLGGASSLDMPNIQGYKVQLKTVTLRAPSTVRCGLALEIRDGDANAAKFERDRQ